MPSGLKRLKAGRVPIIRGARTKRPARAAERQGHLRAGIDRLQALLATLPRPERRKAVESLSMRLRTALLRQLEVTRWSGHSGEISHVRNDRQETGIHKHVSQRMLCTRRRPPHQKPRGAGAVSAISVGNGTAYMARITIRGVSVSSRCLETFEKAETLRLLLADLRSALEAVPDGEEFEELLRQAFDSGGSGRKHQPCLPASLGDLQAQGPSWRFHVRVDARRWAGRLLTSRTLKSVEEALKLRRQVAEARKLGWAAVCELWARCRSHRALQSRQGGLHQLHAHRDQHMRRKHAVLKLRAVAAQDKRLTRLEGKVKALVPRLEKQLEVVACERPKPGRESARGTMRTDFMEVWCHTRNVGQWHPPTRWPFFGRVMGQRVSFLAIACIAQRATLARSSWTDKLNHGSVQGFPSYEEANELLEQIGTSFQSRPIYAYVLATPAGRQNKPQALLTALMHAREPAGLTVLLYFLGHLLEKYSRGDPDATYVLNMREIWVLPFVNPDGYVANKAQELIIHEKEPQLIGAPGFTQQGTPQFQQMRTRKLSGPASLSQVIRKNRRPTCRSSVDGGVDINRSSHAAPVAESKAIRKHRHRTGTLPCIGPAALVDAAKSTVDRHGLRCQNQKYSTASSECFIVRNSWGDQWGDKGYFYMPYAYICNPDLANDFWSIEWVKSFDNAGPKIILSAQASQLFSIFHALPLQHTSGMGNCDSKSAESGSEVVITKLQQVPNTGIHESLQNLPVRSNEKMGWKPDMPDHRDHHVKFKDVEPKSGIQKRMNGNGDEIIDLRPDEAFPIFDQGHLGSCTANALAAAFHFTLHKMTDHPYFKDFTPSRLFIYYNERLVEGSVDHDAGACLRDGIKTMAQIGVCPELSWKYDDKGDFFKQEPDWTCYELAKKCQVVGYARVAQELTQMKMCIKNGYPFVFGFVVYPSFSKAAADGKMSFPEAGEQPRGGHAVTAVGYDDFQECFIVRNSWGEGWGDKGYFYMPFEYICNPDLAHDFWSIEWVKSFEDAGPL
eukprot:s2898_g4.t1